MGAKMIASKNEELWDNWEGWHKPKVFLAEDCEEAYGYRDGKIVRVPKPEARPVFFFDNGRWQTFFN